MKVGDGYRHPGDEIPEAATWRTLPSYLRNGTVEAVPVLVNAGSGTVEAASDPAKEGRKTELDGLVKDDVKTVAKDLGVPVYGSKEDIIDRILTAEFDE